MNSLLLLVGLICLGIQGTRAQCPFGWVNRPRADFCYSVESVQRKWVDANLLCKEQDANLLSVESDEELTWVRNQIFNSKNHKTWWTGLNDIAQSGQRPFVWSDGSAAAETYVKWANGEPNNNNGAELCAMIGKGGYFSHWACSNQCAFICKRKKDQPFFCDHANGWENFNGKCYKSFKKEETYYDAQSICQNENGFLTTVHNVTDSQRVSFLAKGIGRGVWIGLKSTPANNALGFEFLQWDNGDDLGQTFWYNSRYPLKVNGQENNTCAFTMYLGGHDPNKCWQTTACDGTNRKAFMCEKAQGMCSPGWVGYMDQCYKINAKTPMTFEDANNDCTSVGAHLLTIKSDAEQTFVNNTILFELRETGFSRMWFGVKQDQPNSTFMWTTGESLTNGYTNWDTNQPFMDNSNIQGGVLYTGAIGGRWSVTSDVYVPTPYVCEINSAQTPMFITTPAPRYRCDKGWRRWRTGCYYVNTTSITWVNARQSCKDSGADLVDIRSIQENSFIIRSIQSTSWIGINDFQKEGQFAWLDESTPPTFTKWNSNEPNNVGGAHCGEIIGETGDKKGLWNDNQCNNNHPFICKKPASVVGVTNPPTTQSAQWTAKCGFGWDDTMSEFCYRFVSQATTWSIARQTCQIGGGDLLSITSLHEQYYVSARVKAMKDLIMWIGFNDKAVEGRWVWSDQSAVAYFNWKAGEPNNQSPGQDCGVVLTTYGRWDDETCSKRFGYICKKRGDITTTAPAPTPTLPAGTVMGCPSGWKAWRDSCYKFVKTTVLTGAKWLTTCRTYGGDLASIRDRAENNYISIEAKRIGGGQWRIGLNDREKEGVYKWTDGSPVTYTNWRPNEPNEYIPVMGQVEGEDCVELNSDLDGKWNDVPCGLITDVVDVDGLVCKMKMSARAPTTGVPTVSGCSMFYDLDYGQSCYKFVDSVKSFDNAEADCASNGGHLVAVSDASEYIYLFGQLALRGDDYWIGLSNKGDNSGVYSWTSGALDTFSNWNSLHSGNERNKCVAVGTGLSLGRWSDNSCNGAKKYICENDMKPTTSPGQLTCPKDWVFDPVWNKCYRAYLKYQMNNRKTWEDAQTFCQTFGGDLISIHSNDTETIIDSLIPSSVSRGFWIGLNSRDPNTVGHTWSDGSAFNFANWMPNQPDNHNNAENCVVLQSGPMTWDDANCYGAREWICQMPTNTPLPTGAGLPGPTGDTSVSCGQGWIHYNGMCYLFVNKEIKSWFKSREHCNGLGGELASIEDQDENDFLLRQIGTEGGWGRWVGLNELDLIGYRWSDRTPATYFNWAPREPNDSFGAEKCVAISRQNGFWNDDNCNQDFRFICKKVNGSYSTVQPVTYPPVPGYCKNGFFAVGNKCYRYFDQYANYTTALEKCTSFGQGYYLASLNTEYDLVSVLLNITARESFYIGLHKQAMRRKFIWMDNSEVTFLSWANGEPNGMSGGKKMAASQRWSTRPTACVECYNSGDYLTGKWNDIDCNNVRHFLCEGPKDRLANPPVTPINPCKLGYQPYGDSCYKLDAGLRIWDQANRFCQADGATMVSIRSMHESFFVYKLLQEQMPQSGKVWTGLTDRTIHGVYVWSDNWPVTVANWGVNEPSRGKDEGCVAIDKDVGTWYDIECAEALPVVCKISTATPPTLPPIQISECDDGWIPHQGICYKLSDDRVTWSEANFQCSREGATLVSIHSEILSNYLVSAVIGANLKADTFWIGLLKRNQGGFVWIDNTAVGYTKWNRGEPNDDGAGETCVEFYNGDGIWNDISCDVKRGYMCMRQGKHGSGYTGTSSFFGYQWFLLLGASFTSNVGRNGLSFYFRNTQMITGPHGLTGYQFAGNANSYVKIGSTAGKLNFGGSWTVGTFFYQQGYIKNGPILEWRGRQTFGTHFWMWANTLFTNLNNISGKEVTYHWKAPTVNAWHFVGASYNAATGDFYMWLDNEVFTKKPGKLSALDQVGDVYIGIRPSLPTFSPLKARLAGMTLLKGAISTPAQIASFKEQIIKTAGVPATTPMGLPSVAPQKQTTEGSVSEIGLIVGLCCGVILLLAAVSAGVIYWKRTTYAQNATGFDNAMYMKNEDIVNIQGNVARIDASNHQ